ncbi:hypothetical protein [Arthrobacter wenxiniae]|jgi:hypothetical protein|uniref:Uncharacterized protein n=1 Tax=Arthrobacter wenxiniae TaxID=2713570 RepID=A0A7Y7IIY9_9MICC|nr:hypothetical protein [Arthrobacter wenxiniae]NVM96319.1 hypothetical protein [Arthrobacter wenxiniae]
MNEEELAVVTMHDDDAADSTAGRGTMVIRIWSEASADGSFRSRLTFAGTGDEPPQEVVVASHERLLETVSEWLEKYPD